MLKMFETRPMVPKDASLEMLSSYFLSILPTTSLQHPHLSTWQFKRSAWLQGQSEDLVATLP